MARPDDAKRALSPLWSARSVAIVGASTRAGSLGRLPVEFLRRYGYGGRILPVNPKADQVLDLPAYPSVSAAPGPIDLAMILVAADRVPAAIDDCIGAGVPVAIVCSSGFAETGSEGARLQEEVVAKARAGGMRLLGPNCIGAVGVGSGQVASFSPLFSGEHTGLVPGSLGFVSQSGALGYGAVSLAFERGLGLGWIVNTGNEADLSALEVLCALAEEPGCTALLGYVESLADGERLRRLARSGKPVALVKAGRSAAGAQAAASHTGALAAGDRVVDAALRQYGIVRCDDVDELLDVGAAFAQPRRPRGNRVAVVTTSGGSGILAADAVEEYAMALATLSPGTRRALTEIVPAFGSTANPVDVTATVMSDPSLFDRCLDVIVDDAEVDMVVAAFCVLTGDDVDRIVHSLARAGERSGKPVLVARTGADHLAPQAAAALRDAGIPAYPTPGRAVRAAGALWQVSQRSTEPAGPAERAPGESWLAPSPGATEAEVKALLAAAGFPVPASRIVRASDEAVEAVHAVGGRAVLKAVVPGLVHKTEAGAVVLDVTPDRAGQVFDRLAALGGDVLVEEMVTGGVEMLVGLAPSPLGTVVTVGAGGVLTEVLDDVALRVAPVGPQDVRAMLTEIKSARLLHGHRGAASVDADALVDLVVRLSKVTAGWPRGFELDLNPVAVLPVSAGGGVRILDAAYIAPGGTASQDVPVEES